MLSQLSTIPSSSNDKMIPTTNGGIFLSSSTPYWPLHQPVLTRGIHIDYRPDEHRLAYPSHSL